MYNKIKKMCDDNHMSIRSLEQTLNLSNGIIKKWEKAEPKASTLKKIADYFGVDINYFLED